MPKDGKPFPQPFSEPSKESLPQDSIRFIQNQVTQHHRRFSDSIPLIASENLVSPLAAEMFATDLHNRYAEGLPGSRYYEGNADFDPIESHVESLAKRLFACDFADVRPISGTSANISALFSLASPGDKFMAPELSAGAHISTQRFGAAGLRGLETITYPSIPETMSIDTDLAVKAILNEKPRVCYFGQSVYLFPSDLKPMIAAAREVGASVQYDAAHVLGLIAGGRFQDPIGDGADLVTASTHKTFPGPQHGVILGGKDRELPNGRMLHKTVRSRVFPGVHSNHHLHKVAAFGVSLAEAIEFQADYADAIISNAKALAEGLWSRGMKVFAPDHGFTESHTILVDVSEFGGGADVSLRCEAQGLVMNKNMLPGDTSAVKPSGIRLGTPEMTRLGMGTDEMDEVADLIYLAAKDGHAEDVLARTAALKSQFSKIHYCWGSTPNAYADPIFTTTL
ncbi:MAG TPA: serine hydroxymethyltransferase [Candidatus Poseidoniales archaeon]|jgi:glycine hydroxymethyltransferase|nr:MAG: serine hydroxymethyltransferase [Euryarchaeota archaeon]HIG04031.1 serine hydroxymethyltransferase [Candidatus Poseidoniales archaeon]HIK78314.1 serine hydroxymethyltransferase [Candidatus Poseidoniales archaeon]